MVQWYNISWFHNKVCGFHSLIASNLYKRNIDASSHSRLTKWRATIHIHSQNLDKKRPSWLSPLIQFSSPQHGCPRAIPMVLRLQKPWDTPSTIRWYQPSSLSSIWKRKILPSKLFNSEVQCCTKKNDLTIHFRKIKFHSMVMAKNGHACRRSVPLVISNLLKPATRMVLCPATFPRSHSTQHL